MSTTAVSTSVPSATRAPRAIAFRMFAGLLAIVFVLLFGAWRAILAPWLPLPENGDHGWQRTSELHALADSFSGLLMVSVSVAAVLLAIQPLSRSGLVSWTAWALLVISLGMVASTLVQGHAGASGALITGLIALCVFVIPVVLLHPQRRVVMTGGQPCRTPGPSRSMLLAFTLVGSAALAGVVAVVWWRLAGGLFENPAEDDAISIAMLGMTMVIGCGLCATRREGWRVLAVLLAGMAAYSLVAGLTIALS